MIRAHRAGSRLGFLLVILLAGTAGVWAGQNLAGRPVLFPGTAQPIDDPQQFFAQAAARDELVLLKAAVFDPLRDGPPDLDAWVPDYLKGQPLDGKYYLVQFAGPIRPADRQALQAAGARIFDYIPNHALLVRLTGDQYDKVSRLAGVRWIGDYQSGFRVAPALAAELRDRFAGAADDTHRFSVDFFPGGDLAGGIESLMNRFVSDRRFNFEQGGRNTVLFELSRDILPAFVEHVLSLNDVRWVERRELDRPLNDNSYWMGQSGDTVGKTTPIFDHGILGQGQVIAIADSGLDKDACFFIHTAGGGVLPSQTVEPPNVLTVSNTQRKLIAYNILPGSEDGDHAAHGYHGTHTAGSATGDDYHNLASPAGAGHDTGDGMAPLAKLVIQDGGRSDSPYLYFPWPFYDMWAQDRASGVHVASNSWGVENNLYTTACTYTDMFVWDNEDFLIVVSAGNAGPTPETLNYLCTSKNVIAVAATTNGSTGANAIASFSSKGPAADGRIKPDLALPGDYIVSARGETTANNCSTIAMSGTSMAAPTAAGFSALARQYFTEGWYPSGVKTPANAFTPSAALLKAVMINSCANMTGGNTARVGKEDAPAVGQGWGRVLLDNALYFNAKADARKLLVWDVANANGLTTGGIREYPVQVAEGQPLKITLVWTDPPGSESAAITLVNNLDLEVIGPGGVRYAGNQWNLELIGDLKESLVNPAGADTLNNVEGILVKSPAAGAYTIRVMGTNVPGFAGASFQGFGLVATGGVNLDATGMINIRSVQVDDSAGNNDGVIDPGETINLNVMLENTGGAAVNSTNALLATATAGITVTTPTGAYGTIAAGGTQTNASPYVFQVDASVSPSTVIDFNLGVSGSAGTFNRSFQLRVLPSTPPTLSNLFISEKGLYDAGYPTFVDFIMQFDYADPDADLQWFYFLIRVNGEDVTTLPFAVNASSLTGPGGTGVLDPFGIWQMVATNVGETLQVYGYLEDSEGNRSSIVESNVVPVTLGVTPATPSNLDDDDSLYVPFAGGFLFPFYGKLYPGCYINSDGNLTFEAGYEYQQRGPIAFLNNMPRIAGLYTDLAKSPGDNKIIMNAQADRFTVTYDRLAQWAQTGPTGTNTVTITLFPDGAVEFTWGTCSMTQSQTEFSGGPEWKGVVGLCPGAILDYPSSDLSTLTSPAPIPAGLPIYQAFAKADAFDLSNTTLRFEPAAPFIPVQRAYFPRLSYAPGTWTEGYGFVNTGAADANVRFTSFDSAGNTAEVSDLWSWPAGDQGAYQAEGLLGLTQATDGWVLAESDQNGLLGFFVTQHFAGGGLAGLDGAAVFTDTMSFGRLPLVRATGTYSTELFFANPGAEAITLVLFGYDNVTTHNGGEYVIPPGGFVKLDAATVFGAGFDGAVYATLPGADKSGESPTAGPGFIGNATIRDGDTSICSLNIVPYGQSLLYAPHVVFMPDVYYTEVVLWNYHDTDAVATITPYRADGTVIGAPFQVTVPALKFVRLRDTELGLPSGVTTEGWLKVDSTLALSSCLTFGNPVDNHYMSTLPLEREGKDDFYYAQVASGDAGGVSFFTGIAVVNTNAASVDVTIKVFLSDGTQNGNTVVRTLAPGEKYVRLLSQIEGIGTLQAQTSGYIHVTATDDVFSFVLFGNDALDFLCAVPAQ